MAEEKRSDDVEKILADQKVIEDRKHALIDDLLKQREAAMAAFDEKLAKLGYHANSKQKRNHHKKAGASGDAAGQKPAAKPKT